MNIGSSLIILGSVLLLAACGGASPPTPTSDAGNTNRSSALSTQNTSAPDGATGAAIDDLFRFIGADEPGAVVLVAQGDSVRYQQGYGLTTPGNGTPLNADTIFHIGSTGKQLTGVALMLLAQDGLIDYDAPVTTYLPELAGFADRVTIRMLLHHTAGMPDYYADLYNLDEQPTNDTALQWLATEGELVFTPGNQFAYSNAGYEVLGSVVERVSGQSFAAFLDERLFAPHGMTRSFSLPTRDRLNDPNRARGYTTEDGGFDLYDSDLLDNLVGSGSVYASANDLHRYSVALNSGAIVPPDALRVAFTPALLNDGTPYPYGFGWDVSGDSPTTYYGHAGAWQGFVSYLGHYTDADLTIVILSNRDDVDTEALFFEIASLYGLD